MELFLFFFITLSILLSHNQTTKNNSSNSTNFMEYCDFLLFSIKRWQSFNFWIYHGLDTNQLLLAIQDIPQIVMHPKLLQNKKISSINNYHPLISWSLSEELKEWKVNEQLRCLYRLLESQHVLCGQRNWMKWRSIKN